MFAGHSTDCEHRVQFMARLKSTRLLACCFFPNHSVQLNCLLCLFCSPLLQMRLRDHTVYAGWMNATVSELLDLQWFAPDTGGVGGGRLLF